MANNYLQFSEQIDGLTKKEAAWFERVLIPPDDSDEWDDGAWTSWLKKQDVKCEGDIEYWPDFSWKMETDPKRKRRAASIWFYAEEGGNVDNLAAVIQQFLKKFRPKEYFSLTWAETCSSLRLSEFGGGGVFVTAKKSVWSVPWTMFDKERDRHKKAVSKGSV